MKNIINFIKNLVKSILVVIGFIIFFGIGAFISGVIGAIFNILPSGFTVEFISSLFGCMFLFFVFAKQNKGKFASFKKDLRKDMPKYLKWFLIAFILQFIFNIILSKVIGITSSNQSTNVDQVLQYPLFAILSKILIVPIYEEILFRQNFRQLFKNKRIFAIITGLLFGAAHISSATSALELLYILPFATFGIVFSAIYVDKENIYNSIFIHMLNNLISIIAIFI